MRHHEQPNRVVGPPSRAPAFTLLALPARQVHLGLGRLPVAQRRGYLPKLRRGDLWHGKNLHGLLHERLWRPCGSLALPHVADLRAQLLDHLCIARGANRPLTHHRSHARRPRSVRALRNELRRAHQPRCVQRPLRPSARVCVAGERLAQAGRRCARGKSVLRRPPAELPPPPPPTSQIAARSAAAS